MLNSKQRAYLKSVASNLEPAFQVGKGGVSKEQAEGIAQYLKAHELIKITVLKNAAFTAKEIATDLSEALSAECVATIGHKIILYRRSKKKDFKHIEF